MSRYSAQFRNTVLKKLLPPESRSALSLAKEYNLSVATIYGWKSKMRNGTLKVDDGVQANRSRQLAEKLSLLLESRSVDEGAMGEWLRGNGLHSQHLSVWEQEVRDAVTNSELVAREELKAAKKKIREQERELARKEKALAEAAIIIMAQKKISQMFQDPKDD
jgi:transposase-like protein